MMMLMELLKCRDGCSPGDDTQLHRASGQGESRHLPWSPWSLCVTDTRCQTIITSWPSGEAPKQSLVTVVILSCLCLTEDTPATEAFSGRETGKGRIAVAGLVVYSNPPNTDLNNHTRSKHCYFATNRILYKEQSLHATQSRFFYFESRARLWYSSLPFSCNTWQLWGGPVYPLTPFRLTPWDHHWSELVSVAGLTYRSFAI